MITPRHGFLGRTVEVEISGDNTQFDASTTVDFGAGTTVKRVQLVGPTQVVATIDIAENTTVGDRDVSVQTGTTTLVAMAGFSVDPSLGTAIAGGPLLQGDIAEVTLTDLDTTPLGTMPFSIIVPGMRLVRSAAPTSLTAKYQAIVDVSAAPGARSIVVNNAGFGNTKLVADPAAFAIGARPPTAITLPYSASVVFDTRSKVFTAQTSTLGILSAAATNIGSQLTPGGMFKAGSPEALMDIGGMSEGLAVVTRATATATNLVIAGNTSVGNDVNHTLSLGVIHTPVAALTAESGSAHTCSAPQVMTSPSILDGSTTSEEDCYSISVPAGMNLEATVASPTTPVTVIELGVPVTGFQGSLSYHLKNVTAAPFVYSLAVKGEGTAANYTVSLRVY